MKRHLLTFLAISCLALTPPERKIVEGMSDKLNAVEAQNKQLQDYAGWADQALNDAWLYGNQVDKSIGTLSGEIETSHKNEKLALADNARMKPVYDAVTRWWDLGSFVWGFKQLLKHLFILGIVGGLLIAGLWALSFTFPFFGFVLKVIRLFFSKIFNSILVRFRKKQ